MLIEENVERRVRTDCLIRCFSSHISKKQIQIRGIGIIFSVAF